MSQITDLQDAVDAALLEANKSVAHAVSVMQDAIVKISGLESPAADSPVIAAVITQLQTATDDLSTQLDTAATALAGA